MLKVMSLAKASIFFSSTEVYRARIMGLVAWLVRYGPKSLDEIYARPISEINEIANEIGAIMEKERAAWDENLTTGDS